MQLKRDADFAERVRKAEMSYEISSLANIHQAGRSSWRAAAWHLEHTMPNRYAKRPAGLVSADHVANALPVVAAIAVAPAAVAPKLPPVVQ